MYVRKEGRKEDVMLVVSFGSSVLIPRSACPASTHVGVLVMLANLLMFGADKKKPPGHYAISWLELILEWRGKSTRHSIPATLPPFRRKYL